jgi:hypothetical protein
MADYECDGDEGVLAQPRDESAPRSSHCYPTFRAGDTVHHFPTGENWILAVDQFGDEVSPCGWPETIAKASDCTILERASDTQRHDQLLKSSEIRESADIRRREARHQMNIQGG